MHFNESLRPDYSRSPSVNKWALVCLMLLMTLGLNLIIAQSANAGRLIGETVFPATSGSRFGTGTNLETQESEPDSLIICLSSRLGIERIQARLDELGVAVVDSFEQGPILYVRLRTRPGRRLHTYYDLAALYSSGDIAGIEYDFRYFPQGGSSFTPDDPHFPSQWYLSELRVPKAFSLLSEKGDLGKPGLPVAIIDTGLQHGRRELAGKSLEGMSNFRDTSGHGTRMALVAAASTNNRTGIAAPAINSPVVPVKVDAPEGFVSTWSLLKGINWCGIHRIKIACISLNTRSGSIECVIQNPRFHMVLHRMLRWYHDEKGGLAFVAAGNKGSIREVDRSPALPYLILIGGIDREGLAVEEQRQSTAIKLCAPAVDIIVPEPDGSIRLHSGNSYATALAAGVAAMVWSAAPTAPNTFVESALMSTAVTRGAGRRRRDGSVSRGVKMPNAEGALGFLYMYRLRAMSR